MIIHEKAEIVTCHLVLYVVSPVFIKALGDEHLLSIVVFKSYYGEQISFFLSDCLYFYLDF